MLSLIIHKLAHLFAKDKSPEALEKLDADIERDLTGLRITVVVKVVIVIISTIAFLFCALWIVVKIF